MKEVREIYSNVLKDKEFYIQKIADQRDDIKDLKNKVGQQENLIKRLQKMLNEEDQDNKQK